MTGGAEERAVDELDRAHGAVYDVGVTRGGTWYARRADGTGEALEADNPVALDAAIRAASEAIP